MIHRMAYKKNKKPSVIMAILITPPQPSIQVVPSSSGRIFESPSKPSNMRAKIPRVESIRVDNPSIQRVTILLRLLERVTIGSYAAHKGALIIKRGKKRKRLKIIFLESFSKETVTRFFQFQKRKVVLILISICLPIALHAKDLGLHGHVFAIEESNLLSQIMSKLHKLEETGQLEAYNKTLLKKARQSLTYPQPVQGLSKAIKSRIFYYDPSLVVPYDLKDHKGRVFHKKGTRVNPLETRSLTKSLIFINGDDAEQVRWVQERYEPHKVKLILTGGSPFDVMEQLEGPVYFDQKGILTSKLRIRHVPAVVSQEGSQLRIEEVAL